MSLLATCSICDALLKGYGNNTRCERCSKPCPVCGGNRAQCHHPLEDVPEDRWTVTRSVPFPPPIEEAA